MSKIYIKVPIDWVVKRSEEEILIMESSALSKFDSFFASKEKKKNSLDSMEKSMGRINMLKEIITTFKDTFVEDTKTEDK